MAVPETRVLVVEDDPSLLDLLAGIAAGLATKVIRAVDGLEALSHVARCGRPSLVISDIDMPRMDGLILCAALREWFGPSLPILVCSGQGGCQAAALAAGANGFLPKPYSVYEMRDRIRDYLANAAAIELGAGSPTSAFDAHGSPERGTAWRRGSGRHGASRAWPDGVLESLCRELEAEGMSVVRTDGALRVKAGGGRVEFVHFPPAPTRRYVRTPGVRKVSVVPQAEIQHFFELRRQAWRLDDVVISYSSSEGGVAFQEHEQGLWRTLTGRDLEQG